MTMRASIVLVAAMAGAAWPMSVWAQDIIAVQVGDLVRLRTQPVDGVGPGARCQARVAAIGGDTLMVTNVSRWGGCPRQTYGPNAIRSLDVARGHRGSRLLHAGIGLLGGATAGGLLGWGLAGDGCQSGGCDDGGLVVAILTFAGIVTGGVTGTIVGAALPAGPRWVRSSVGAPVRVAGLRVHPSIRWVGSR